MILATATDEHHTDVKNPVVVTRLFKIHDSRLRRGTIDNDIIGKNIAVDERFWQIIADKTVDVCRAVLQPSIKS